MIRIEKTKLEGVLIIKPDIFEDHRGRYVETFNENDYKKAGISVSFPQDDYSLSCKNVLRGLHGDEETWKLVFCPLGKLLLAVVNFDQNSTQFKHWETFELSEQNCYQVLIPPKFANGHLVLSEKAVFSYKQSTYYAPGKQFTIKWDDPALGIDWPITDPIQSTRDQACRYLS